MKGYWIGILLFLGHTQVEAGVFVFANRAEKEIAFQVEETSGKVTELELRSNDCLSFRSSGQIIIRYQAGRKEKSFALGEDSAWVFGRGETQIIELRQIGFDIMSVPDERIQIVPLESQPKPVVGKEEQRLIKVKLVVDDEEPLVQKVWEKRLRARVAEVSQILERQCAIKLVVEEVGTWKSDDRIEEFKDLLAELERDVPKGKADVVIGFSSQARQPGAAELGASLGPFRSHLLITEWSRSLTDAERVEILLHEMGHYLGAVHSPEKLSCMRPRLHDGQALKRDFVISFDPVNLLAINLITQDPKSKTARQLRELSPETRVLLFGIYHSVQRTLPEDPCVARYLDMLGVEVKSKTP